MKKKLRKVKVYGTVDSGMSTVLGLMNLTNELIEKGILFDESNRKMLRKLRRAGTQ